MASACPEPLAARLPAMRILLPPSEGKTPPASGPPLDLAALHFPPLHPVRRIVLDALTHLCRTDPEAALQVLGLGPSRRDEVHRNATLAAQSCAPAETVYSGVLYGALDLASLPAARESVLIASGLFGLLRPSDPIPAYRLSGTARLPGLPTPRRTWSDALAAVLDPIAADHLVVDMRSQAYAGLYRGEGSQWVPIRVVSIRGGRRVTVSHHNKATKGALGRGLVSSGESPSTIGRLRDLVGDLGWDAQVAGTALEVLAAPPAPSLGQ
jgi:cytoplasmic iron level regulating protein YaaA (DUF328/UPF0246 family)